MKTVRDELEERISAAMQQYAIGARVCPAMVTRATDPRFGDYQANGVMALAKKIKADPRKLAEKVVKDLDVGDICEQPEVAGPGFINLQVKSEFAASRLLEIYNDGDNELGIDKAAEPKNIVVDFSCPNIAKQMHVGHLRSTIIGDSICRALEALGHNVIRQNHIGDWGLPFGMLIAYMREKNISVPQYVSDAEAFYKEAKKLFDTVDAFAVSSAATVADLHSGDESIRADWDLLRKQSLSHYQEIYDRLGVKLTCDDVRGESFYEKYLPDVIQELKSRDLAKESEGAVCVFPPGFKNKEGQPLPFIIQKSDGAYLYATTDLAALRYRVNKLKADAIIYVTDARQKLHFEMLFATARMAGWVSDDIELSHVMFGSVLGQNGRPLKTREGENVKLKELLDEAVERARTIVEEKNPGLDEQKKGEITKAVGIGAVKYADYSNNRDSDYVFSFDRMLAMEGNTAPYMQYAYARIRSIERKAQPKGVHVDKELSGLTELNLTEPAEIDLAKCLIRYGEAIQGAAADYRPNYLTAYLYELAQKFSVFYTNCPVLDATAEKRPTRLLLCRLAAETIKHGLSELLGIEVVEQM